VLLSGETKGRGRDKRKPLNLPRRRLGWMLFAFKRSLQMAASPIESIYVFAAVAVFLGTICLIARRILGTGKSAGLNGGRNAVRAPHFTAISQGEAEGMAVRRPAFVPPPMPRDDREYFQGVQDARDHDLPAPLPPPARERDEW